MNIILQCFDSVRRVTERAKCGCNPKKLSRPNLDKLQKSSQLNKNRMLLLLNIIQVCRRLLKHYLCYFELLYLQWCRVFRKLLTTWRKCTEITSADNLLVFFIFWLLCDAIISIAFTYCLHDFHNKNALVKNSEDQFLKELQERQLNSNTVHGLSAL